MWRAIGEKYVEKGVFKVFDAIKNKILPKNKMIGKHEKTLDSYLLSNRFSWKKNDYAGDDESDKYEFLKENFKPSSVIPENTEHYYETPDNLGYFNTRFGTIAVGNKKYDKKSPVVFSLVPEGEKDDQNVSDDEIDSPNYYFGNSKEIRKKKFLVSEVSFKYDPERSEIQKLKEDNDGVVDSEKELLYTDDKEDYLINELKKQENINGKDSGKVEKRIDKIRDIKREKEEDNEVFLKELNEFIHKLKRDKLKKRVESDDAYTRRKRIVEFSLERELQGFSLIQLRKRLEELLEREERLNELPQKYKSLNLDGMGKQEIMEVLKELLIPSPEKPEFA